MSYLQRDGCQTLAVPDWRPKTDILETHHITMKQDIFRNRVNRPIGSYLPTSPSAKEGVQSNYGVSLPAPDEPTNGLVTSSLASWSASLLFPHQRE